MYQPKQSASELRAKIENQIKALAEATDAARLGDVMSRYLEFCSKFHRYSLFNIQLIFFACPQATMVAGYCDWKNKNRFVRKGEQGIPILAPLLVKEKDDHGAEVRRLAGFKVVYVFDVSQTDGESLPEQPNWKSPAKDADLQARLVEFAGTCKIEVKFAEIQGDLQGFSAGGVVVISQNAGTKTIIHELAHEFLHQRNGGGSVGHAIAELEAESVAFVVAMHFGLDNLASPNYIALHGNDAEQIMSCMDRIRQVATLIINGVEKGDSNDPVLS